MPWNLFSILATLLFAVYGFYCALCRLVAFFAPRALAVSVSVMRKEDAERLELLLQEARRVASFTGTAPVVVLISTELMDGTVGVGENLLLQYETLFEQYGVRCYLIDPD